MSDLPLDLTLSAAAALLEARDISAHELVSASLVRVEDQQAALNTFLSIDRKSALDAAAASDRRRAQGTALGTMDGIPVAHKDLFDRIGRVTTAGSIILKDRVADQTATVLRRLDAAGAIEIGTLGASEFAAGATGHNRHFGDCHNPWDLTRIPGGSSGASASAIAARQIFASLGTDTGGSIRLPAHFCGVVGLRPTQGRVSRHGVFPRSWAMDAIGPMARTAEDAAIMLQAIAGPGPDDLTTESIDVPDYSQALHGPVKGLRIGVPAQYFFDAVDESIRTLLDTALTAYSDLGITVVPVDVPDPNLPFGLAQIVALAEAAAIHEEWIRERPTDYDYGTREMMAAGFDVSAVDYLRAMRHRGPLLDSWLAGPFSTVDALFTPVMDDRTPTLEESAVTSAETAQRVLARFGRCTRPVSYLGLPAIAVPCGFQGDGMPAAFQMIGRPFDEATLLRLAHAYQQTTDWHRRTPSIVDGEAT